MAVIFPEAPPVKAFTAREMREEGFLLAINERFLWPRGLGLVMTVRTTCGGAPCTHGPGDSLEPSHALWDEPASLHLEDVGEVTVSSAPEEVAAERRQRFARWERIRASRLSTDE